jgi:hypothetical protein
VQWGVLWGLLLSAAEFFIILPLHNMPLPLWCLLGCTYLLLARHAERSGAWRMAALGGLAAAFAWSAYQPLHVQLMNALWPELNLLGPSSMALTLSGGAVNRSNSVALWAYNLWLSMFYGGLLVAGYALSMRGERTRAALRDAALARGRTEALLGELRLQTLRSQIDPTLLLAALDEVQRLYPRHGEHADALLERLVDFLRAAMRGLKDRGSSLRVELHLAQAFARLQALMPLGARWQVELPRALPELAFPSLLLLPIMALAGPKDSPRLVVRLDDARVSLQVQALGCELPAQVEQRTRSSLAALSPALRMRANDSPQTQLVIELEPARSPQGDGP